MDKASLANTAAAATDERGEGQHRIGAATKAAECTATGVVYVSSAVADDGGTASSTSRGEVFNVALDKEVVTLQGNIDR